MKKIRTSLFIPAPPEVAWAVLTDFQAYEEWNPLNIRARGRAALGEPVDMTFINPARPGSTVAQIVTVTEFDPFRRLAWVGAVPILFRGRHFFELHRQENGTSLVHGEDMSGLIPLTFSNRTIEDCFVPAYEAANRALAERVLATNRSGVRPREASVDFRQAS